MLRIPPNKATVVTFSYVHGKKITFYLLYNLAIFYSTQQGTLEGPRMHSVRIAREAMRWNGRVLGLDRTHNEFGNS